MIVDGRMARMRAGINAKGKGSRAHASTKSNQGE
jgi:hypothetical protein